MALVLLASLATISAFAGFAGLVVLCVNQARRYRAACDKFHATWSDMT